MPLGALQCFTRIVAHRTCSQWPSLRREPSRRPQAALCSFPDSSDSAYAPPLCMGGASLNREMAVGPSNPSATGRDETEKGQEGLQLFFLLPHFYTMYFTQFRSQGNDSKSVEMQGPENGVRLCLAFKSASLATPPPNIPVGIKMGYPGEAKKHQRGRNCTRQYDPEGGGRGIGSGTGLVVQPLWRLRLLPWNKGSLVPLPFTPCPECKKLIIQIEKATKR